MKCIFEINLLIESVCVDNYVGYRNLTLVTTNPPRLAFINRGHLVVVLDR